MFCDLSDVIHRLSTYTKHSNTLKDISTVSDYIHTCKTLVNKAKQNIHRFDRQKVLETKDFNKQFFNYFTIGQNTGSPHLIKL